MYFQDIRVNDSFFIITKEAQTQTTWPQKAQTQTKDIDTQIPRRSQREASLRCSILIKKYTEILTKDSDYDNDSDSNYDSVKKGRLVHEKGKMQKIA